MTWFEWVMLAFLAVLYVASALPRRRIQDVTEGTSEPPIGGRSSAVRS